MEIEAVVGEEAVIVEEILQRCFPACCLGWAALSSANCCGGDLDYRAGDY